MLSVIIPTLNEEHYLPNLLEDLRKQTLKDFEIVVSDGGSTDKTIEKAQQFGAKTVVSQKRLLAHQRNQGAKAASGDTLIFFDADIRINDPSFLELVFNDFQARQLTIATFLTEIHKNSISFALSDHLLNLITYAGEWFMPVSHGGIGIMVSASAHEKSGGFDEELVMGEDHEYAGRIGKNGKYGVIKVARVVTSTRRMEKYGTLNIWLKWFYSSLYFVLFGNVKKEIISYDMYNQR